MDIILQADDSFYDTFDNCSYDSSCYDCSCDSYSPCRLD